MGLIRQNRWGSNRKCEWWKAHLQKVKCAPASGSSALCVQLGWCSEHSQAKEIKLCSTIHGAFNELQAIDLTFDGSGTPGQGESQLDRVSLMDKRKFASRVSERSDKPDTSLEAGQRNANGP